MTLQVSGLCKHFSGKPVLLGADLTVGRGEFVSVTGPSGVGKSTIARILCGTLLPDGGRVTMDGETVVAAGEPYRKRFHRQIQLIPQQPYAALDPRQRIGEAIEEPLLFHKLVSSRQQARRRAMELLDRMWLDRSLYQRRPGELSGGQAQRVLIARSLTLSPRLLIADEATSMLDVSSQSQILRIFRELIADSGLSILCISHDMTLVQAVSHRVYRLREGVLQEIH